MSYTLLEACLFLLQPTMPSQLVTSHFGWYSIGLSTLCFKNFRLFFLEILLIFTSKIIPNHLL